MTTPMIKQKAGSRSLDDAWRRGPLGYLPRPRIRRRVSVIAIEHGEILDVTGPLSTFALVNTQLQEALPEMPPAYDCDVLARSAGPVNTSAGVTLIANRAFGERVGPIDTLILSGGRKDAVARARSDPHLIAAVRRLAPKVRRLASVCTGTFILAEAGLIEGRTVTTHWSACRRLAEEFPGTIVEPNRIFIRDGSVYTSAGVTAGIDLALAMIEDDLAVQGCRNPQGDAGLDRGQFVRRPIGDIPC
jgi:transcriptional regulator GlxA family with amidase domain